jgi:hypothetical protein
MAPNTDAVVADVRDKRHSIDRRIETLRGRLQRFDPRRAPWQGWSARAWPFFATAMMAWLWMRRRHRQRFMRLP